MSLNIKISWEQLWREFKCIHNYKLISDKFLYCHRKFNLFKGFVFYDTHLITKKCKKCGKEIFYEYYYKL